MIEAKPIQTGQVRVDANAMARAIAAQGRVALYGIYFDTGKAEGKPESKPALDEIAKLLKQNPAMKLLVVGHTDNAGDYDYNLDLSRRRAQAVTQVLTAITRLHRDRFVRVLHRPFFLRNLRERNAHALDDGFRRINHVADD